MMNNGITSRNYSCDKVDNILIQSLLIFWEE